MSIFNQFSFVVAVIALILIVLVMLWRMKRLDNRIRVVIVLGFVVIAVVVGLTFRYPDSPVEVATVADVEAVLANGQPTFVMLYSNY